MPRKKEATFEENLEKLGEIVSLLEKCMEELSRVEKEMDILIKKQKGGYSETELQIEGDM